MKLHFIVPHTLTNEQIFETFEKQERQKKPGTVLNYLDPTKSTHTYVRHSSKAISKALTEAKAGTMIICYSGEHLNLDIKEFIYFLEKRKHDFIVFKLLQPCLTIDIRDEYQKDMLYFLSDYIVSKRSKQHQDYASETRPQGAIAQGAAAQDELSPNKTDLIDNQDGEPSQAKLVYVPSLPISEQKKERIRFLRSKGVSYQKIAEQAQVSSATARKYSSDIKLKPNMSSPHQKRAPFSEAKVRFSSISALASELAKEWIMSQRSPETCKAYLEHINVFANWLKKHRKQNLTDPKEIQEVHLRYFRDQHLTSKGEKWTRKMMSSQSSFLSYCIKRRALTHNPMSLVKLPIIDKELTTSPIPKQDLDKIIASAVKSYKMPRESSKARFIAFRNVLIVMLLSRVGMRVSALIGLKKCDVKYFREEQTLELFAKGKNSYKVAIDFECASILNKYLRAFYEACHFEAPLIASWDRQKALTNKRVNLIIEQLCEDAGVRKYTCHNFRVTFATEAHLSGMNIRELQKRLGHKSCEQTASYIKPAYKAPDVSWVASVLDEFDSHEASA